MRHRHCAHDGEQSLMDTLDDHSEYCAVDPGCPVCRGTGIPDDDRLPEAPAVWGEHRARVRAINRTCLGIAARLIPGMGGGR
jgi:hypothetical protein